MADIPLQDRDALTNTVDTDVSTLLEFRRQKLKSARKKQQIVSASVIALCLLSVIATGFWPGTWLGFLLLAFVGRSAIRGRGAFVWLRRFHRPRWGRLRFEAVLGSSCVGLGSALTVQDSSYHHSIEWFRQWQQVFQPLLMLALVAPIVVIFLLLPASDGGSDVSTWVLWLCPLWFVGLLLFLMRHAYLHLSSSTAHDKMSRIFQKIRAAKGLLPPVLVVQCEDSFWRDVVRGCLQEADVAIIDVSELTENVIWELEQAVECLGIGGIVIACGTDNTEDRTMPQMVQQRVEAILGQEVLRSVQVFVYPETHGFLGLLRFGLYKSLSEQLRHCIARCMVQHRKYDAFYLVSE